MEDMFISVLNMSLTASYVIAVIMLARLFLKKAPKIVSYALWAVVGFRLVFPFSFESVFSLIPFKSAPIPAEIAMQPIPRVDSGINFVDNAVSQVLPAATPTVSVNPLQIWLTVGAYLWLTGIAVMLIYSVVSIVLLKRRLRGATLVQDNIYEADNLKTPFVLGLFRPKIYIPAGLTEEKKCYIILHERTHIRRHDHVVKFLAYFILSLHWFNPFAWAAFLLMGTDMEMSCDERVLKEIGGETKKAYSMSLLSLAAERRIIGGSPLAFGEGNVKGRIKNVLNYKKPVFWIVAATVVAVAAVGIGLAVNPIDDEPDLSFLNPNNLLSTMSEQEQIKITSSDYGETYLSGSELAKWLDIAENDWSKKRLPPSEELDATITIQIDDTANREIRFFASEPTLALVVDGDEKRYYGIPQDDYYAMEEAALLGIPHVQSMVLTEHKDGKDVASVTISDADAILHMSALILQGDKDKSAQLVNDTPSLSDYIRIEFKSDAADQVLTYFVYYVDEKNCFIEKPYSHIDKINMNTWQAIVTIFTGVNGDPQQTSLEPITVKWSPKQSIDAVEMAKLDYASNDIVIFHGYFGLFVYDLNSLQIIRSLDLKPLNCTAIQGDDYCDVAVSTDGNTVQLHRMSSNNMYVYTVSDNTLQEMPYERMSNRFGSNFVSIKDVVDSKQLGLYSFDAVKFDTGEYGYLHTSDWTLGTFTYVRGDMVYKLFEINTNIVYTEEEIQAAMECVKTYFSEVATSRVLNDLWFDEEACTVHRTSYMQYGKGQTNGVLEENVIVLLCNFTIENDETFKGYYPNWLMILIRDSADGAWRIDDQGV